MNNENQVKPEDVLEKVQGGVNLNGSGKDLADNLAGIKVGVQINKDAKNTGGNNNIFKNEK